MNRRCWAATAFAVASTLGLVACGASVGDKTQVTFSAPVSIAQVRGAAVFKTVSDPARHRVYATWSRWSHNKTRAFLAVSEDDGRTWQEPVQITDDDEAQFPVARVGTDGRLWVVWAHFDMSRAARLDPSDPYSNPVWERLAYSDDGGRTFSAPVEVKAGPVMHQFPWLSVTDGAIAIGWLDYTPGHPSSRDAVQMQATVSDDGGTTWGPTRDVAPAACVCCQPFGGVGPDGRPLVTFRDWRRGGPAGDVRDIATSTWERGEWSRPTFVHRDDYRARMCPAVGPATALDDARRLHVVYWVGDPHPGYWYSTRTAGTGWSEPVSLAQTTMVGMGPSENNNTLAVDDAGLAWTATVNHGMYGMHDQIDRSPNAVTVYSIARDGTVTKPPQPTMSGSYPQLVDVGGGLVLTWVDHGTLYARTVTL